jgi:predicted metalloendopeptidase
MKLPRLIVLSASLALIAAAAADAKTAPKAPHGAAPAAQGIDLAGMDRAVKPGDDFFAYANGTWVRTTPIPADRSSWGLDSKLAEQANLRTRALLEAAAKAPKGSAARKAGDYYAAYMNATAIEARGLKALNGRLERIAAIADKGALATALGQTLRTDVDPLNNTNFHTDRVFGLWVAQDFNQPDRNGAYLLQGGLGMPDREYYLADSPRMADIRAKYRAHIATILKLAGIADAEAKAGLIFDLETKIAKVHVSREDSEDVHKGDNPWTRAEFDAKAPGLDWTAYFKAAELGSQERFIVWQPAAITGEAALVASEPLDVWKAYLAFRVVDHWSNLLPKAFVDERFAFYGKTLSGTPQLQDRWKRAVASTSGALGDAVGQLYVARYFPPPAKAKAEAMVAEIKAAFDRRIDALDWMSPQTKAEAKAKLKTLVVGVGYPDRWRDYSGLAITRDDPFLNAYLAESYAYDLDLKKLTSPVDRHEWWMTPQTVNAVNLPIQNALNFPAAILQPPYFDPKAPGALNYGAIGATIGHEISHSFDDQGSQFDSSGRLANWWTPQDFAHFKSASAQLVAQYSAYHPLADLKVNGQQTLSENIADVAGLSAAYDAYRLSLHGKPDAVRQGLDGDQQFFLSFAQSWRDKFREALLRRLLLTDGHSPSEYRADTVRNLDAWYTAFKVRPGETLYLAPKDRVQVW